MRQVRELGVRPEGVVEARDAANDRTFLLYKGVVVATINAHDWVSAIGGCIDWDQVRAELDRPMRAVAADPLKFHVMDRVQLVAGEHSVGLGTIVDIGGAVAQVRWDVGTECLIRLRQLQHAPGDPTP